MDTSVQANISHLPLEILEYAISGSNIEDILALCRTNKQMAQICQDESFWKQKVLKEFGHINLGAGEKWFNKYLILNSIVQSPISGSAFYYTVIDNTGSLYHGEINPYTRATVSSKAKVISVDSSSYVMGVITKNGKVDSRWGTKRIQLMRIQKFGILPIFILLSQMLF
jgi:hypothetical protein